VEFDSSLNRYNCLKRLERSVKFPAFKVINFNRPNKCQCIPQDKFKAFRTFVSFVF